MAPFCKKFIALFSLILFSTQLFAQGRMTAQEQANLQFVDEWWRTVLLGGRLDQAADYMAEDYIQHNPNISTGRSAFVDFFSNFAQERPIPESINPPPVIQFAKGDYVVCYAGESGYRPDAGGTCLQCRGAGSH